MPLISTAGAASVLMFRRSSQPQPRGGGGGADGFTNTYPGSFGTETAMFYNSGGTFTVPTGVTLLRVRCIGAGGGGSDFAPGGAGGYAEAIVSVTEDEVCTVSVSAGGAYGASGGTGGAKTSFTCAAGVVAAGGGGGAGGMSASAGSQGTNSESAASNGGTGNGSDAGDGGNSFITSGLTYKVQRGTTSRVPSWADGTVVDTGYPAASGGEIGAHGGEGKIYIQY